MDHRVADRTGPSRRRRNRLVATLAVLVALGLTACTPEDRDQIANEVQSAVDNVQSGQPTDPATEAQPTEEPQTEEPQTEEPQTEEPQTEEPTEEESVAPADDLDLSEWLPWIIGALVALALLALIIGAINRRRRNRAWAHAQIADQLGDVIGTGRWILDQGTTEALRLTDPSQLERSWQSTRQQMIGLEEDLSRMLVDADGDPLANALKAGSEASAGLRSALDADVARRVDPTSADDAALAQSMRDTVQERRNRFRETLDRLATFR